MSVYVYAICRAPAVAPATAGLRAVPLRIVRAAGLLALVSDIELGAGPLGCEEDLWQHERVVEALMTDHDVLPVRFGTLVVSDGEVRALLRRRAEQFTAALARVAGAVEVGVRAVLAPESSAPSERTVRQGAPSGTGYMLAAKRREQRVTELREMIARALSPLARSSIALEARGAASATLASSHLVGAERLDDFRERAQRLADELDGASLVCTGPWPPYSFVGAAAGDAR